MKMEKTKKFDQCLKNLLTVSGMGRDELARVAGVSVPVVNRWLNGASAPRRVSVPGHRQLLRDALWMVPGWGR